MNWSELYLMIKNKNILDNMCEYIYKLRCGVIVMPIKSYSNAYYNLGEFEGYKFVDEYILFGEYKYSPYKNFYAYDDRVINCDDYEWNQYYESNKSIGLTCKECYENSGRDYDIVAYKLCKNKQDMIDNMLNENNIIWTWICDDYE